jgi:hypothetical protein
MFQISCPSFHPENPDPSACEGNFLSTKSFTHHRFCNQLMFQISCPSFHPENPDPSASDGNFLTPKSFTQHRFCNQLMFQISCPSFHPENPDPSACERNFIPLRNIYTFYKPLLFNACGKIEILYFTYDVFME